MKRRSLSFILAMGIIYSMFPAESLMAKTMKISKTAVVLERGKSFSLKVSNIGKKKVKWTSNKGKIATVNSSGKVKAVAEGGATIKARVGKKSFACRVVVTSAVEKNVTRSYGIIPAALWKSQTKLITSKEFCGAITNIVKKKDASKVSKWKSVAKKALSSKKKVTVDEAMLAMYEAAIIMGIDTNYGSSSFRSNCDWESRVKEGADWWAGRSNNYLFDNALNKVDNRYGEPYEIRQLAAWYFQEHRSLQDNSYAFAPNSSWTYEFATKLTRAEAIHALRVFTEGDAMILDHRAEYVSPEDVGMYDASILTETILNKPSSLPEVEQSRLPSSWKGMGLSNRLDALHAYVPVSETDIRSLRDHGLNFVRFFLDFKKLQFPYTNKNAEDINEYELKRLDQTLAWCIQNDVHLRITCLGYDGYTVQGEYTAREAPLDSWKNFQAYWEALTRRYKGISSKFLTFDLMNQFIPDHEPDCEPYVKIFGDTARAIWAIDPNRVVVKSFGSWNWTEVVDKIAAQGIAIDIHPYMPRFLTDHNSDTVQPVPAKWPMPYLKSYLLPGEAITIDGRIGGTILSLYLEGATKDSRIEIIADSKLLTSFELKGKTIDEYNDYRDMENPYEVKIPPTASKIEIHSKGGRWIRIQYLTIKKGSKVYTISPADQGAELREITEPVNLTLGSDGFSNTDGMICGAELIYRYAILPNRTIAQKHSVGFTLSEFGVYGEDNLGNTAYQFIDDMLTMFEKHDIGWCYCEAEIFGISRFNDEFTQSKSKVDEWKYSDAGKYDVRYYICHDMMEVLKRHL